MSILVFLGEDGQDLGDIAEFDVAIDILDDVSTSS
jgi:hypothetical protein